MNIENYLNRWTEAGIISPEQRQKIVAFEAQQPSAGWIIFGLSGLGILVVLTGVISLIAANWYELSATVKLSAYFLIFIVIAYAAFKRENTAGVIRESLLSVFGLYALAGIGLIGQIYHLKSSGYQGLFLWLVIILPVTLCTKSKLLNNIWFIGLATAVSIWVTVATFDSPAGHTDLTRLFFAISLPYLFLAVGYYFSNVISENFCSAARFWSYVTILLPFAIFGNMVWAFNSESFFKDHIGSLPLIPFGAAVIAIVSVALNKKRLGNFLSNAINFTITASILLFILPISINVGEHEIIGCLLFIAVWAGAAAIAAALERRRLFDFAALVIGLRFIIVYFEVFGSLAATGFGLILSGAVILGTAYLWHRYRGKVITSIQESL